MATTSSFSPISEDELESFSAHLNSSHRILALLGAGLSASSGLPTFRGAGGYWRNNDAVALASPDAFAADPGLVWQFYSYRRHMAIRARPNPAHLALAALARHKTGFLTISQNVDGLSTRAKHPKDQLELLHGSLFDIRCTGFDCDYTEKDNFKDPIVPALDIPKDPSQPDGEYDISNAEVPLRNITPTELPHCPKCKHNLLRPGVVWFGESLPASTLERVDAWMHGPDKIDLLLVVGTSALVYPAAGYIAKAKARGARVAVINTERPDKGASNLKPGDWFFQGDAGSLVPQILESVTGQMPTFTE
ncbi:MAG: hypothetical protein M1831_004108 [Alyxoria varia]|nr:MAG: hypothetical protein M1831_004108 [Alyxoria varia]